LMLTSLAETLPPGVIPCGDGKLRWSYTLNLWRQPFMLYTALGATSGVAASFGLLVCFVRMGMDGFASAAVLLIMGLSYLILCLLYKGKYTMQFEMDEAGILHTEALGQQKKSRRLGVSAAIVCTATGYSGAMRLVAEGQGFYSRFAQVRVVKAVKKQNLIWLSGGFAPNRIYASPEQFDFVWQCIIIRSPKGKMYE
jgi:hypothetical protein